MNRYMAIFEDYDDIERIGSVRSCRTYYTYFAREYDAIYAHYGQSTFAVPYLKMWTTSTVSMAQAEMRSTAQRTRRRRITPIQVARN